MQGQTLITRQIDADDRLGQLLTVTMEDGLLSIQGVLLKPICIKNYIFSNVSLQEMKFPEVIELFGSEEIVELENGNTRTQKKLLGAGELLLTGESTNEHALMFNINLLDDELIDKIKDLVGSLGLSAYDRFYPIMPEFEINEDDLYCNICDENINICKHNVGEFYFNRMCKLNVRGSKVLSLVWSGLRDFSKK